DPRLLGLRRLRVEPGRADVHPPARHRGAAGRAGDRQGAGPLEPLRGQRAREPRASGARAPARRRSLAVRVAADLIRAQLLSVLRAWGMSDAHAATTAAM